MKKVFVTCMILFAAISSSFAYDNNSGEISLTAPGSQAINVYVGAAPTEIDFECSWVPTSGIWSNWDGTGYSFCTQEGMIDFGQYTFGGLPQLPYYHHSTFNTGLIGTLTLYYEAGPDACGSAKVWW